MYNVVVTGKGTCSVTQLQASMEIRSGRSAASLESRASPEKADERDNFFFPTSKFFDQFSRH